MNEITYNKNYISLPVEIKGLPETTTIENVELKLKTSFHVSLLCVKNLISKYGEEVGDKVIDLFKTLADENLIEFQEYKNEYRLAQRESDNRKTLVTMVTIKNLEEIFQKIRKELQIDFDSQPTHITLYTLVLDEGIGINDVDDLNTLTKIVTEDVSGDVRSVFK
jgi:hypothetical protein